MIKHLPDKAPLNHITGYLKSPIQVSMACFVLIFLLPPAIFAQESNDEKHQVFLIGNTGNFDPNDPHIQLLRSKLNTSDKHSSLIFLGDLVAPAGMPGVDHKKRSLAEKQIKEQLLLGDSFKGDMYVIPGDRDWDKGRPDGWSKIRYMDDYIEEYLDDEEVFFPKQGHPGPVEIKLEKDIYLIVFDMQWMLHRWDKSLQDHPLEFHNTLDVLVEIDDMLEKHRNHHVILASHHPIYSDGPFGGQFSIKHHLFPTTEIISSLYLPLPIIGSLYPLFRSTAGGTQDIAYDKYKTVQLAIEATLKKYDNVIYISGHEKSLQHLKKDGIHYINSGTGSESDYVKSGKYAQYVSNDPGFGIVTYFGDGASKLQFWTSEEDNIKGNLIHESVLYSQKKEHQEAKDRHRFEFKTKTVKVKASEIYKATNLKKTFFGTNYRDVWEEEVEVELFDITKEKGGLTPIKMGGGLQTKSLRLEAKNGKQYVLRSVEKYPEKSLPDFLKKTIAVSIIQDQISASHPYAAYVIPDMADAAGIFHTNPRLVFIPDDGAFGKYRKTFANTLALFEERPAGDWSDAPFFGNSEKIISSPKVEKLLLKDHDNVVDQQLVLKSRLFDMIIADWDRHEDQWRWASYKTENGKLFKPIPRDRDQTFFTNEGVFPKIASRKWAIPKVEGFNNDVRWSPGFNFNARYFDRVYLNELNRKEWIKATEELQSLLTDKVIEDAIQNWPEQIFRLTGEQTISTLKARRDNLKGYALELYDFLTKEVEIKASNKTELIVIEKRTPEELTVTVKKISKKGKIKQTLYDRHFYSKETREIRIYAMGGNDQIEISGDSNNKIKVRIIGGDGDDKITDTSSPKTSRKIFAYDRKQTEIDAGQSRIKNKLSNHPDINEYDKYWYKYDNLLPIGYWRLNPDDGLFIGGGFLLNKFGWRKKPFASRHFLTGDIAIGSKAFNIKYQGDYTDVIGSWDLGLFVNIQKPFSVDNFFGLGNESEYDFENREIDFYRARFENNLYRATLSHPVGGFGKFIIGGQHLGVEVEERPGRFLAQNDAGGVDTSDLFESRRYYSGIYSAFEFDSRNDVFMTTRGVFWQSKFLATQGLNEKSSNLTRISSEFSWFYSPIYPSVVTIASRTGFAHNFGEFEFYNANKIGGITNLRGFRRTRFYGKTSFYQNIDLRIKLFSFRTYLLPGNFGILGFYDIGRVWLDGETSDKWHRGVGGGIWISPLGKLAISMNMAFTEEENLPFIGLGFFF